MNKALKINMRVIKSGNVIEIWEYEKPTMIGIQRKRGTAIVDNKIDHKIKTQHKNLMESYHNFIRLLNTNFLAKNTKFITLTFDDSKVDFDIRNIEQCNKQFTNFIKKLRYRYEDFKYASTISFQYENNRKAICYHMLTNIDYIEASELAKIWNLGFIKIKNVNNLTYAISNIGKCMIKHIADDRLIGKKRYWTSRNLKKPKELYNDSAELFLEAIGVNMDYSTSYNSENNGIIKYKTCILLPK